MNAGAKPMSVIVPNDMIARLIPRYAEPHRRYHTWRHIAHVFLASERISSDRSLPLTLAIFYHDAVCRPGADDNEERSASLLLSEGERCQVSHDVLREAAALVRMTSHGLTPSDIGQRASVLLDADLSILGEGEEIFGLYEEAIYREYEHVASEEHFRAGRKAILEGFLARKTIFLTERGRVLWEKQARTNLTRSIAALEIDA